METGIETKDLVLTIEKQVPGELVTNAIKIKEFVESRVKDYTPERYYDDPDAAKRDRAVLNTASKELNTRRLALEREFMAPFNEFKDIIKQTTTVIDGAASKLDEIVKAVEETIKNEKRGNIENYFISRNFTLVSLDRIFDLKWLNKTVPFKDVQDQLNEKIQKIYADIEIIEGLPADVDDAKASYLETLDIGTALATAKRLKENRERLEAEAAKRQERKHDEHIEAQAKELAAEEKEEVKTEKVTSLVDEALDIPFEDPIMECTLRFRTTKAKMLALKVYMTNEGIEYDRVD